MATWGSWLAERMPQGMLDRARAAEAAEAAAFEAEQVERAERQWAVARAAQARENSLIYSTGHSSEEWREAAQRVATAREMQAMQAQAQAERAASFFTGADGQLVRMQPTEQTRPGAWTRDPQAELLKRARNVDPDGFMARMVAEYDARRGGRHITRTEGLEDTVHCVDCLAVGATATESFELHHGDDPLPERFVPDSPPMRSRRVRSGTGWPELVR